MTGEDVAAIDSEYRQIEPILDCSYTFPIDSAPSDSINYTVLIVIPSSLENLRENVQSKFGLIYQDSEVDFPA